MTYSIKQVFFCFALFLSITVIAQEEPVVQDQIIPKRTYTTVSIAKDQSINIDGSIDDEAWEAASWTSDFTQWQPDNGKPPTEQTKMKILYDANNVYVAFKCYDKDPGGIVRRLSRRDGFDGDWVEVNFDSYDDDRTGFSFTITAAGVKGDEFISNNGNFDESWNPIWYTKTKIDADGWTAEMRIPLSQLRFSAENTQTWGLQATRRYFRNEERSTWQAVGANAPGWVSEFGILKGINNIEPQRQLEIQPYGLAQLDTYETEEGNPFRDGSDTRFTAGLDAKVGITNDLTLDVTINPDFGQVDADPGAIALDGFEIFFQERRPFFIENKNIFDYNISGDSDNLFFSRRIGRSPQGSGFGPATAYLDQPNNTTILGAAKFSGKTKDGWSVGVLESVTSEEFADVIDENGEENEVLVEPLTNYVVGRVQKDFNNNNSYVGGIFTGVHRNMDKNISFLHTQAFSGGLDFRHNWKNRNYYLDGNIVTSTVRGNPEAIAATQQSIVHLFQREDADHVEVDPTRTSLTGTGGKLAFGKSGGGNWRYNGGVSFRSPELELNDIGFLRQADIIRQFANVTYRWNLPGSWYRRANMRLEEFTTYDFQGNYNRIQYDLGGNVQLKNNGFVDAGVFHKPRIFITTFLRGGPRWRYSQENGGYLYAGTDERKKFRGFAGVFGSQAGQDNFSFLQAEIGLDYQPTNAINISLRTDYTTNPNKTQYVAQAETPETTRYITGEIDQKTLSATLRVNYTINPNLTVQYYGQPFIAKGKYSNFNYVTDADALDLNERVQLYNDNQITFEDGAYLVDENGDNTTDYAFGDPDFAVLQYRSNLVIRWEYIPGSELFAVWSQGVNGFSQRDASEGFNTIADNQLFTAKPENTFLVKWTYRFVL
ncbi:MAG: DUF5916 domain-containing protein [Patiriisocius sp.]|uniref:DUF5916 domain-containing protein n=1 Tax=Patiriisocius sp. TaxID=2822396 RepID=UPI003EF910BA